MVKLAWGDHKGMVVAKDTVLSMRVPLSPSQWRDLRELVDKAKDHIKALKEHGSAPAPEGKGGASWPVRAESEVRKRAIRM